MLVFIAGGGRTGTQLALLLLQQNHDIRVLEHRPDVLKRLHRELPTEIIYEGRALDPQKLELAEIRSADVFVACTDEDADNLAICYMARHIYKVPRIIGRINNPRTDWLYTDLFHVDVALNQPEIFASMIEQEMAMGDMMTLMKLKRGAYSLVDEKIASRSRAIGVAIKDLKLPENCVIAAIIREGKVIMPRGVTTFEVEDEVLAVTDRTGADKLATLLSAA
ncbi:MAG: NAD-binding protein [Chloroflexi bacterium]|nr:NAD-binding protein [Chloroflexota bacterium]MBP8057267.1 NAD-binding protein [Chloroflexota bacterium]